METMGDRAVCRHLCLGVCPPGDVRILPGLLRDVNAAVNREVRRRQEKITAGVSQERKMKKEHYCTKDCLSDHVSARVMRGQPPTSGAILPGLLELRAMHLSIIIMRWRSSERSDEVESMFCLVYLFPL